MTARRDFGNIAKMTSGRYRATWKVDGERFKAPMTFKTKTDAKAFLTEVSDQISKGTYIAPEKRVIRTVRFVGGEWLASNINKAPTTLSRDTSILTQHVYPVMGDRDITTIERHDIQKMVSGWSKRITIDSEGETIEKVTSAETVKRQYTCMASMFNYAALNRWIPRSPCEKINLPTVIRQKNRHLLTSEEIGRLADAIGTDLAPSVYIAAEIGIRWNEIYAIRVCDVDIEALTVTIAQGITRESSGASVIAAADSDKSQTRTVHISSALGAILADHISRLDTAQPDALLFADDNGGLIRYTNWRSRNWLPALMEAGLDKATDASGKALPTLGIHDLRRLAATRMLADGVDLRTVMHRLGQKTATLALEVYAQADVEADKGTASKMGSFVFGPQSRVSRAKENVG